MLWSLSILGLIYLFYFLTLPRPAIPHAFRVRSQQLPSLMRDTRLRLLPYFQNILPLLLHPCYILGTSNTPVLLIKCCRYSYKKFVNRKAHGKLKIMGVVICLLLKNGWTYRKNVSGKQGLMRPHPYQARAVSVKNKGYNVNLKT